MNITMTSAERKVVLALTTALATAITDWDRAAAWDRYGRQLAQLGGVERHALLLSYALELLAQVLHYVRADLAVDLAVRRYLHEQGSAP